MAVSTPNEQLKRSPGETFLSQVWNSFYCVNWNSHVGNKGVIKIDRGLSNQKRVAGGINRRGGKEDRGVFGRNSFVDQLRVQLKDSNGNL